MSGKFSVLTLKLSKISRETLVIAALFLVGLVIRFYRLAGISLYDDEIMTWLRIGYPFWETISLLRHSPFPPFHYAFLNLWSSIFGYSEWALRFPSAIFSSLTIIVTYKLGKELFNKEVGLVAASLLVFSPFAIYHAQSAKMYALFWFLGALSFLYFSRILKGHSRGAYLGYIVTMILSCYTMYLGYVLLLTQNIIFFLSHARKDFRTWLLGQLVILSIGLPWVMLFLNSKHEVWDAFARSPDFNLTAFFVQSLLIMIGSAQDLLTVEEWTQFVNKFLLWRLNLVAYVILTVLFVIDFVTASFHEEKVKLIRSSSQFMLVIWILCSAAAYLTFAYVFIDIDLSSRYLGFIQIPIFLLISFQICNFKDRIKTVVIVALIMIAASNTFYYFRDIYKYPQQDWRSVARDITESLGNDDIVISLIGISRFKYYYKGDTSKFFLLSESDCSSQNLRSKGVLSDQVKDVFILFKKRKAPEIVLDGFKMEDVVYYGNIGYIHYKKID